MTNTANPPVDIKYGVPQGSILGFLLFLRFIDDLENSLDCSPRLFADDACIIANASTAVDLETKLNLELRKNKQLRWLSGMERLSLEL